MSVDAENAHARLLLDMAAKDESTLQYPLADEIYGFHAQQASEKLLKALLTGLEIPYPKTHSLLLLIDLLAVHSELVPALPFEAALLEPFAVTFGYDHGTTITELERSQMKRSVEELRTFVLSRIASLGQKRQSIK